MESIADRIDIAQALWTAAAQAESTGDYESAYQFYTEAHDLIMDCAKLHQRSHEQLRRVNVKLGNYGELLGDWILHLLAPLGIFELIAYFSKTDALGSILCKRNA